MTLKHHATLQICTLLLAGACGMSASVDTQAAGTQAAPVSAPAADAARKLWASSLPDPAGRPQSLARFAGRVVVINFWASWCGPCVEEMPVLAALYNQYKAKGVDFVGIGVDSPANVSKFLATVKVDYPLYVAGFGGADIARRFGNGPGALPFTVIVDRAGQVRYAHLGIVKPEELKRELGRL